MAVSAIVAAVSTASGVFAAGSVAAFTFAGLSGFAAVATGFLVSTAMGAALNALTPKPKIGGAGAGDAAPLHLLVGGKGVGQQGV